MNVVHNKYLSFNYADEMSANSGSMLNKNVISEQSYIIFCFMTKDQRKKLYLKM